METLGQMWSNSITQNEQPQPVVTNESIVSQNMNDYYRYKKGILQGILQGAKLNNEQKTSR